MNDNSYLFIEFPTPEEANNAIAIMNGFPFDAKHTFYLNHFTDIETFSTLNEQYVEPKIEEYTPKVGAHASMLLDHADRSCDRNTCDGG